MLEQFAKLFEFSDIQTYQILTTLINITWWIFIDNFRTQIIFKSDVFIEEDEWNKLDIHKTPKFAGDTFRKSRSSMSEWKHEY